MSASFGTSTSICSAVSLLMNFSDLIGKCCASIGTSVAAASIAASFALSKSGAFTVLTPAFAEAGPVAAEGLVLNEVEGPVLSEAEGSVRGGVEGSTMTYRLPSRVSYEYQ